MIDIYEKALRKARLKVFDDDKYTEIILFCKKRLSEHWYNQHQQAWNKINSFTTL